MRRCAAAFAFAFVASLVLAAYGHCWPMLAVQLDHEFASHEAHHHAGAPKQHHHPTEGFGQELSVPGVQAAPVATMQAPVAKPFVPVMPAVAAVAYDGGADRARPNHRARAGPPAFTEFHARTGRLLI
jgi:hypothetical protein